MSMARRGVASEEMRRVAKDADIELDIIVKSCKWFYHYTKK